MNNTTSSVKECVYCGRVDQGVNFAYGADGYECVNIARCERRVRQLIAEATATRSELRITQAEFEVDGQRYLFRAVA